MDMDFDKESAYDQEIAPLMEQIIEACKRNDIPMVASFCYGQADDGVEDFCTTFIPQRNGWSPDSFKDCRKMLLKGPVLMAFTVTTPRQNLDS